MSASVQASNAGPRIGYLLKMYPRFSQTFVVNEILELERQGLDLRITSLRKPTDGVFHESVSRVRAKAEYAPETILEGGRRLLRMNASRARKNPSGFAAATARVIRTAGVQWIDLAQAAWVLRWTKKQRIDHVHVHFGTNEATVAMLAHRMGGLSYSMTLHAFDIFRDNVDRNLLARKINASRFAVTVSEYNRSYIIDHMPGVDPRKVHVNYNGIDLDWFQSNGARREPATILGVGRLIEKKGFIHLVRAVGRLAKQGLDVNCRIVGDGPESGRLRREIERAGLETRVRLVGTLEQNAVRDAMRKTACFVLPCVQAADGNIDALPTVLLESMASGCPSISTRLSGVPEIIEDGASGLLVSPGDDDALAEAIRSVITDEALAGRLSTGGRKRAENRFDVRRNVRVMHDWFVDAASCPAESREPAESDATSPLGSMMASPVIEARP